MTTIDSFAVMPVAAFFSPSTRLVTQPEQMAKMSGNTGESQLMVCLVACVGAGIGLLLQQFFDPGLNGELNTDGSSRIAHGEDSRLFH